MDVTVSSLIELNDFIFQIIDFCDMNESVRTVNYYSMRHGHDHGLAGVHQVVLSCLISSVLSLLADAELCCKWWQNMSSSI